MEGEAGRYCAVSEVLVPPPPMPYQDRMPGRCYVKYGSPEDAAKGACLTRAPAAAAGCGVLSLGACRGAPAHGADCCNLLLPPSPRLAGFAVFHGRTLDGNVVKAAYVPEEEYARAAAGEWVSKQK